MIDELEAIKRDLRAVEGLLGVAHERAAVVRDALPSGPGKAMARRIADRVERALSALEAIE